MILKQFLNDKQWARRLSKMSYAKRTMIENSIILQTPFLPQSCSIRQRAWHIKNDVTHIPLCQECRGTLSFRKTNDYPTFCSVKCASKSPETIKKRRKTELEKFGGDEEEHRKYKADILKKASREKYGVDNFFQAEEVKGKIRDSLLGNYGVDHPSRSPDIRKSIENTMIKNHGVKHALQSPKIMEKFTATMQERHSVPHALRSDYIRQSIKDSNISKFGRSHHAQTHISERSLELLNDRGWLVREHHDKMRTLDSIAEELRVDKKTVSRRFKDHGIELRRYPNSLPEREIRDILEAEGIKVISNDRDQISPYELDLFMPDHNLAVEYCGLYWHSEINRPSNYHKDKYEECNRKGIRLITIFENEWLSSRDKVINTLLYKLGKCKMESVYARNCHVREVDTKTKAEFFNVNHIQGDGPSSINYGLFHGERMVACMGFIKRADHFILNRYATSFKVPGGFLKILRRFEKELNYPEIVTFADLRWSQGQMYYNCEFVLDKEIEPDYYWCKDKVLWHKFNWRHSRMQKKLIDYDSTLTEAENMHNHGFYKIYDCGKLRFVKNRKGA